MTTGPTVWLTRIIRTVVFTNFRTWLSAVGLSFYQVSAEGSITSSTSQELSVGR